MSRSLGLIALAAVALFPAAARAQEQSSSFTQRPGARGCLVASDAVNPGGGCAQSAALSDPVRVAVAPGDRQVYVVGAGNDLAGTNGGTVFTRDPGDGALAFASCVSNDGGDGRIGSAGVCTDGDALSNASGIAFSPDGTDVYVSSAWPGGVAWFARD